ncbi:MAG: hypothetical protein WCG25_02620 [bacterium]
MSFFTARLIWATPNSLCFLSATVLFFCFACICFSVSSVLGIDRRNLQESCILLITNNRYGSIEIFSVFSIV